MKLFCSCDHDLEALRGQVEKLSQTSESEKRKQTALGQDFEELQDKVYRWMQRTLKRDRDARPPGESETEDSPSPPMHPLVRRIQERRARRMNGLSSSLPTER